MAADWASKWWVLRHLEPSSEHSVIPGMFQVILVKNPGIAFGFFQEGESLSKMIVLSAISILGLLVLIFFGHKIVGNHKLSKGCLVLIIGGVVGNLGDRLYHGWVTDFLDIYWRQYHWPTFNLADSYITIGVLTLACLELIKMTKTAAQPCQD